MDEKTLDKVYNAVRILIKEQKQQSLKILELEKKIETNGKFMKQIDEALSEEKDQIDKRFDSVIDRFDNIDNLVVENVDTIADLEEKNNNITKRLTFIEEMLKKVNGEIEELEKKVEDKNNIKQCRFDRVGFCMKGPDQCNFFHAQETCDPYLRHGYCNRVACYKRHPRKCIYFERGYCKWNEDCRYFHESRMIQNQCENCDRQSSVTYYCEICDNSYCNQCTVEDAHLNDPSKLNKLKECKTIHI